MPDERYVRRMFRPGDRKHQSFVDTTAVEIYVNGGEVVFSSRYYPKTQEQAVKVGGCGGWEDLCAEELCDGAGRAY